jgi:ADP-ribose pyrophosphatase
MAAPKPTEDNKPEKRKLHAEIKKITPEFNGFLSINRYEIEADRHEGGKHTVTWLLMERGHAVAILGYDPARDEVVLGNEMRPGVLAAGDYPYTDNLPAGGIPKGETAVEAAIREMVEEQGLELKNTEVIHEGAYVSSGGTSEKIAIVFGTVDMSKAGGVHGLETESENIKAVILKSDEFLRRVRAGEITDLKTIVAGYWLAENRDRLQQQYNPKTKQDNKKQAPKAP